MKYNDPKKKRCGNKGAIWYTAAKRLYQNIADLEKKSRLKNGEESWWLANEHKNGNIGLCCHCWNITKPTKIKDTKCIKCGSSFNVGYVCNNHKDGKHKFCKKCIIPACKRCSSFGVNNESFQTKWHRSDKCPSGGGTIKRGSNNSNIKRSKKKSNSRSNNNSGGSRKYLINPKPNIAKYDSKYNIPILSSDDFIKFPMIGFINDYMVYITKSMMNNDLEYGTFSKPVTGVAGYYQVIKKPMDLGTVLNKIKGKSYKKN